jgi:hypothetical protein
MPAWFHVLDVVSNWSRATVTLLVLGLISPTYAQPHFQTTPATGQFAQILVQRFAIDGQMPPIGSEVGIFDGSLCVGAHVDSGARPFAIPVILRYIIPPPANDTLPGAVPGHLITLRIWNSDTDAETCGFPTYQGSTGHFAGTGSVTIITLLDVLPMTAPTIDSVTSQRCDSVIVWWSDGIAAPLCRILRNGTSAGTVAAGIGRFADRPSAGTYTYNVQSENACGESAPSDSLIGRRRAVPGQVIGLTRTATCSGNILTWRDTADEDTFRILRNTIHIGSKLANDTTFTDTSAVPGIQYSYTIRACNLCGCGAVSSPVTATRLNVPTAVSSLAATANLCTGIRLNWSATTGQTGYTIRRDTDSLTSVSPTTTTYLDSLCSVGPHTYIVAAFNACGYGNPSPPANGTRLGNPEVPADILASDALCGQVIVSWTSGGGNVDSFRVYRNGTRIGRASTSPFTDIVTGTYAYTVRSWSIACQLESAPSAPDSGTGHAAAGVPSGFSASDTLCNQIRLSWTASTGEVQQYIIFRDNARQDSTTATTYIDATLNDATPHVYRVLAKNPYCGESQQSQPDTGRYRALLLLSPLPDTMRCDVTYRIPFNHCPGVQLDSIQLSLNGGPYNTIGAVAPVLDTVNVRLDTSIHGLYPNCRVRVISYQGARRDTVVSTFFTVDCRQDAVEISLNVEIPTDFFLSQNFPNPFNPSTQIRFGVPHAADITIEIFDILGRKVATVLAQTMQPGIHSALWDCSTCPSGMYMIRMQAGDRVMLKKMLLMK